jgi:5-hydroxyisourate hydrolase-like protein (transthyretin family)
MTSHVLDTASGLAAAGMRVVLRRWVKALNGQAR